MNKNPFSTLGKKTEQLDPESDEEVDGLFGCDVCHKAINVAHYSKDKTLYWTCPDGHLSKRLRFNFGSG